MTPIKNKVLKFFEEFDSDADKLYQEEVALIHKGKIKTKLKYPESFYNHWQKKFVEFVINEKNLVLKDVFESLDEYWKGYSGYTSKGNIEELKQKIQKKLGKWN